MTIEAENRQRILKAWYERLDADYGEHNDPSSACSICMEAYELGIVEEGPDYSDSGDDPRDLFVEREAQNQLAQTEERNI